MNNKNNFSILLVALIAMLGISGCSTESFDNIHTSNINKVLFKAADFKSTPSTRTNFTISGDGASFKWAANDTVGIFPTSGMQTFFSMESGSSTNSASFSGGGWALKSDSSYYAYYPFSTNNSIVTSGILNKIPVSFTGQKQVGNNNTDNVGICDFMYAQKATPTEGNVTFNFNHMVALLQLTLTAPQADTFTKLILSSDSDDFIESGTYDLTASNPTITAKTKTSSISMNLSNITTTIANQVVVLYIMVPPCDFSTKNLKATLIGSNGAYCDTITGGKNFKAGYFYTLTNSPNIIKIVNLDESNNVNDLDSSVPNNEKSKIDALIITGEMSGIDITDFNFSNLKYLDMSDVKFIKSGYVYHYDSRFKYYTDDNEFPAYFQIGIKTIILPKSIKEIGCSLCSNGIDEEGEIEGPAFEGCASLTSVIIPNGAYSIFDHSFDRCTSLAFISMPSISEIGAYAFNGCTSLTSITTSAGDIGNYAFNGCTSLTSIIISSTISLRIGIEAFSGCDNLQEIHIKNKEPSYFYYKDSFDECIYSNCKLYVPKESVELYKAAAGWNNFENIIGE